MKDLDPYRLPVPDLDDRTFEDLRQELMNLLPRFTREWSDFNPSDPGIMFLELFAFLSEQVMYSMNRSTETLLWRLLELSGVERADGESLVEGIQRAIEQTSRRYRAISVEDYEELAVVCLNELGLAGKAICYMNQAPFHPFHKRLYLEHGFVERTGNISLIVLVDCSQLRIDSSGCFSKSYSKRVENETDEFTLMLANYLDDQGRLTVAHRDKVPSQNLRNLVWRYFYARRLLGVQLHVLEPFLKEIQIDLRLRLKADGRPARVEAIVKKKLQDYFNPFTGGPDKAGWPVGRNLFRSEVFEVVELADGVDHVTGLVIRSRESAFDEQAPFVEHIKRVEIQGNQLIELLDTKVVFE